MSKEETFSQPRRRTSTRRHATKKQTRRRLKTRPRPDDAWSKGEHSSPHCPPEPGGEEHVSVVINHHTPRVAHPTLLHGMHETLAVGQLRSNPTCIHTSNVLTSQPDVEMSYDRVTRTKVSLLSQPTPPPPPSPWRSAFLAIVRH